MIVKNMITYQVLFDHTYKESIFFQNSRYFVFIALCHAWEAAAKLPENSAIRQVIIRSGVVLGRTGGMIKQTFLPFYFGLGGPLGDGKQPMPWIHIKDLVNFFIFALKNDQIKGVFNGVAPEVTIKFCKIQVKKKKIANK